jgi:hypothetical protein
MKKQLLLFVISLFTSIAFAQAPAFPGAEGVARWTTTGGRGGKIYHVTNLKNSGTGSLRAAVEASGARIVVFDVAGTINLTSRLTISKPNITILGQTAPGDGICIKGQNVRITCDNVIIRFIRFRMGDELGVDDDALNAYFKTGGEKSNIIIDHCSLSWSTDECGSFYGINNVSVQWCLLSESLRNSVKSGHGFGGIWGGNNGAYHHNLLAHHSSRNPRLDHDYVSNLKGPIDMVNNVIYNWGYNTAYGGESCNTTGEYKKYNFINNYYKAGPTTGINKNSGALDSKTRSRIAQPTTKCSNCTGESTGKVNLVPGHFYVSGNYVHDYPDVTADNWKGIHPDENTEAMKASIKSDTRFIPSGYEGQTLITTHTAEKAFGKVLSYVGASFRRDALDERITKETHDGTTTYNGSKGSYSTDKYQGIIDSPNDVGGWPTLEEYDKQTDTDQDGIPDAWETVNNLNPNDASDGNKYTIDSKNWYTNLEVYANSLVEDIVKAGNAEAESAIEEYYPAYKTPTGISTVRTTAISATEYYDLNGRRLAEPQRGVSIRVERLSNGQSITSKVIK